MNPHDEELWAEELADALETGMRVLRWIGALVALYIIGSIGAALWVTA
jgi:hypothetical protein